ncbi:uncharacterized protein [Dermacentor andersoni]|uniref:uncharacterized protein n=1 Tax=Dermacentor andersoni TaxID=34620 RepID=UPI003B3B524D
MYNKKVLFSEMYPPKRPDDKLARQPMSSAIKSNCTLGTMLRQEKEVKENLASLDRLFGQPGQPKEIFGVESIPIEEVRDDFLLQIVVTEEECNNIARQTILQSGCPQWHCERALRVLASSKVHRIKTRQAGFESLGELPTPQSFKSAACECRVAKEHIACKQ